MMHKNIHNLICADSGGGGKGSGGSGEGHQATPRDQQMIGNITSNVLSGMLRSIINLHIFSHDFSFIILNCIIYKNLF